MQSGMLKRKWHEMQAMTAGWTNGNPGSWKASRERTADDGYGAPTSGMALRPHSQRTVMPRLFSGLLLISGILMLTYVAASALVNGFAPRDKRMTYAMVEQQAAADYRKARVRCQALASSAREACIAEAHAAEARSRAVADIGFRDYKASLKAQTDAFIDAGDKDSIIVEPACNIVARGQGSLCEIQTTRPNGTLAGTNLIPATLKTRYPTEFAAYQPRTTRVKVQDESQAPAVVQRPAQTRAQDEQLFQLAWSARQ